MADTVAGLRNLGNTCYLNAVLQALASCQTLLKQLESALEVLGLAAGNTATAAAAGPPAVTAGPPADLAAELLSCLQALQPQPRGRALQPQPRSVAPRSLVAALRAKLPRDVLGAGQEHDAAEAVETLCALVTEELQACFAHGARQRLAAHASLAAVLGGGCGGPRGGRSAAQPGSSSCVGGSSLKAAMCSVEDGRAHGLQAASGCGNSATHGVAFLGRQAAVAALDADAQPIGIPAAGSSTASGDDSTANDSSTKPARAAAAAAASKQQLANLEQADQQFATQDQAEQAHYPSQEQQPGQQHAEQQQQQQQQQPKQHLGDQEQPKQQQPSQQQPGQQQPDQQQPDRLLRTWRHTVRLPLQGSNAHELQCLRCRHRSVVQLAPFWVLPLGIPVAPGRTLLGNVPAAAGASLAACLASFYCREAVQGMHCTRCSLAASLEAAAGAAEAAAGAGAGAAAVLPDEAAGAAAHGGERQDEDTAAGQQPQAGAGGAAAAAAAGHQPGAAAAATSAAGVEEQQTGMATGQLPANLQRLQQVLACGGTLVESEAYQRMVAQAGLAWLPRPSPAVKRIVAAQLPQVLCLQLRRGFWSEQGHVKVAGRVRFPLQLALPPSLVPLLGHETPTHTGVAPGGVLPPPLLPPPSAPMYLLRAVVVHHGSQAGAGHYTVFRCLGAASVGPWVRVSDEAVHPAALEDVMHAQASMLLYEARSDGGGLTPFQCARSL